ncbi:MAG TPA: hypothetical protein VNA30_03750 [Mycobacteriales bacterium]|nr:hypothetical protein [Mycobacteriales bacterium]
MTEREDEGEVAAQPRWGWVAQFLGLLLPVLLVLKLVTGQWFPPGSFLIGAIVVLVVAVVQALRRRRQANTTSSG